MSPRAMSYLRSKARKLAKFEEAIHHSVYISRRKTNRRFLINRYVLDEFAFNNGFANICFEDLSFLNQISTSVFAKRLLGQHGSGMDFTINLDEGSKALHITGKNLKAWPRMHGIISEFGIDCRYLFAKPVTDNSKIDALNPESSFTSNILIEQKYSSDAFYWIKN